MGSSVWSLGQKHVRLLRHCRRLFVGIVTTTVVVCAMGCAGQRGDPFQEPSGQPTEGTPGSATAPGPVRLRYQWSPGTSLQYGVVDGYLGSGDQSRRVANGAQDQYAVAPREVESTGVAVLALTRTKVIQVLDGQAETSAEPSPMETVCRVDSQGRVLRVVETAGDELPDARSLGDGNRAYLTDGVIGFPPAELMLGALFSCPLPEQPVSAGAKWEAVLPSPLSANASAQLVTRYTGEVVGLERVGDVLLANLRISLRPPRITDDYVASVTFDASHGRVVALKWLRLPGEEADREQRKELAEKLHVPAPSLGKRVRWLEILAPR